MGEPWATHGGAIPGCGAKICSPLCSVGADDGIRIRDPHLGKVMDLVRRHGSTPLSGLCSASPSVQSAESAPNNCELLGRRLASQGVEDTNLSTAVDRLGAGAFRLERWLVSSVATA